MGGFNAPGKGFKEDWEFVASRLTGQAELRRTGVAPVHFTCRKAERKF